jgi:hypothetical protein
VIAMEVRQDHAIEIVGREPLARQLLDKCLFG